MSRRRTVSHVARLWLVLVSALAPANLAPAQGTIAYYQPTEPLWGYFGRESDLNGDGRGDFRFFDASYIAGSYWATHVSGIGSTRLLVIPHTWMADGGSSLAPLPAGYSIGGTLIPELLWAAHDAPNAYGSALLVGSYITDAINGGPFPVGYFYGTTAFMGIQFQIGDDWHYGWVRIRGGTAGPSDDGFFLNPPSWILDWAYETRPDMPIFAGAVPEPSTFALLVGGGVLVAWFRRKRNERRG
ncbi:MAG: PEP-CTERM sorting domain-containing protein [Verrucomicrobiota bacterium]|nr:PEP-CTERM sorting domain-containing protein [Verrucomicrobiota bacterium]